MTRINLISGPRNISTAMMYAWANRPDTSVVDEPMYAYYLDQTGIDYHPGTSDVLASLPTDLQSVLSEYFFQPVDRDIYFIKGMAHHYVNCNLDFLLELKNVFLIRHPNQLIASFAKVIEHPTMQDIGLQKEWEIYQYLIARGQSPIVLDSNEVLKSPRQVLSKLCQKLDIDFDERLLSWAPGSIAEDGVWAPYWYDNVWKSIGWGPPDNRIRPLKKDLLPLYNEAMYYYNQLRSVILE